MALDAHVATARGLLQALAPQIGDGLAAALLDADQSSEAGIAEQRERVEALRRQLAGLAAPEARRLETLADYLVKKSVWLVGGDGWAYDIGYGGLDHVLANRRDVNILVMDTEVYSNTGGQASKATPLGAAAKFAAAGKPVGKKDLGLLANMYGHVYVAKVAFGAKMAQTAQAFLEAESYAGPSLIIAYSHCIAHGYDMAHGASQQKLAVDSGVWPLYRFDPRRLVKGEPPLHLDYGPPKARVADYMRNESRFRMVERADPARYKTFVAESQAAAERRYAVYQQLAGITVPVIQPAERRAGSSPDVQGEVMDLSTTYLGMRLPHPLIVGAGPLGDDLDRRQSARRRRRGAAGAALAVRGGNHRRADGRVSSTSKSTTSRSPRRAPSRPIRSWRSVPTSTSSICG